MLCIHTLYFHCFVLFLFIQVKNFFDHDDYFNKE